MGILIRFQGIALLTLCLLSLAGGGVCAAPLLVAVEDDAAPWSQLDGTGFANEVVRVAFNAARVDVELMVVLYARCKDMAIKGRAVACLSMSWLPEFAGKIVFSDQPLFRCYVDYFVKGRKFSNLEKQEDLPKGTVVGIVNGYEYPEALYALQKKGIVVFEESETEEQSLKKLAVGRIDTAVVTHNETKPASLLLAKAGVTGVVTRAFRSGINGSYIGFSTAHPEGMWALPQFNRGLQKVLDNGSYQTMERKWRAKANREVQGQSGTIQNTKARDNP